MKLLYPQFLWALTALLIPVLIHLFNFRRYTTVYFSSNRFLNQAVKESKAINRLRQLLIMLSRMIALALLVIAFAQPYWPAQNQEAAQSQYCSIYIDNSPSMQEQALQTDMLSKARTQAVEIVKNLPQQQKVQVLSNDFKGRQLRFYSKSEAIEMIDKIGPSYAFRNSKEIVNRIKQAQEKEEAKNLKVFWISDFQKSAFNQNVEIPESWSQKILPVRNEQITSNIAIDSLWFESPVLQPNFDQELKIQLSQSGDAQDKRVSISLKTDEQLQGVKEIEIKGNQKTVTSFNIRATEAKVYAAEVNIDAGAPYFDNSFFFSYNLTEPFNILVTGSESHLENFKKLYSDSIFKLNYVPSLELNYGDLHNYDLIIINKPTSLSTGLAQAALQNLKEGKNVVLIPNLENANSSNIALQTLGLAPFETLGKESRTSKIYWKDAHYKGVFSSKPKNAALPSVQQYFNYSSTIGHTLLELENGDPLLIRVPKVQGQLLLFTTDFENSDLEDHPIFVPTFLNAALYSKAATSLYTISGKSSGPKFKIKKSVESPISIVTDNYNIIPRQRKVNSNIELFDITPEVPSGNYALQIESDFIGYLALNPQPEESKWSFYNDNEIADKLQTNTEDILEANTGNLAYLIGQTYNGTSLWQWFIAAAILFLLVEIILIKFWK